ncbi:MAG: ferritin-like domain-containing protein [Deltaproteobacteria bacterium]|nr:ferritin-like domain-containing protein [Deltaproteobacteria bacterium]
MEKLMPSQRRMIEGFEVIEHVDEGQIAALRRRVDVAVPLALHWTWEYGSEVEELRQLYERGKRSQWNAETDLDWSIPMPRDEWFLPREGASLLAGVLASVGADDATCRDAAWDEFSHTMSQLLHGEQAALQLCGQLTNACPTMDKKFYAGSQVIDEVRHVEVISKFLSRKMGVLYPVSPTIKFLLDKLLEAPTWKLKTLGMQCLFEGVAVGIFDIIKQMTTNPLLKEMLRRVELDESRHAAFGILTMRRLVEDATPEEMAEFEEFAFEVLEALNANQQLDMLHDLAPKYGLDPEACVRVVHGLPNWHDINSEVYMHTVMPNLVRLGLVTERTEGRYRKLGILSDTRSGVRSILPLSA